MCFDPLSALILTSLINGVEIISEKMRRDSSDEYYRDALKMSNKLLNGTIRGIREKSGVELCPEITLDQIQGHIRASRNCCPAVRCGYGEITIDPDNQEYIINLLEKCAAQYREYEERYSKSTKLSETYRERAESYEKTIAEAKELKEKHAMKLKEEQIAQEKTDMYIVGILLVVIVAVILFIVSILS